MSLFPSDNSVGKRASLALCYAALMVDGFDLATNGLIAPRLAPEFAMGPAQLGTMFGLASLGLLVGALGGGSLGDRFGHKWALVAALLVFGFASLLSALAMDVTSLIALRLVTGIGIGAALPNVLSYVATLSHEDRSAGIGMLVASAVPVGGGLAGLMVFLVSPETSWRFVVSIGGVVPLGLAIPIALFLPNGRTPLNQDATLPPLGQLLAPERRVMTITLWASFFLMLIISYILLNWLPTFFGRMGLTGRESGLMMLVFSYAGAASAILFGILLRKRSRTRMLALIGFGGTAIGALGLLVAGPGLLSIAAAVAVISIFQTGGQYLLYGLSPTLYPPALRGSGAGAALAAGRLGAIVGPIAAGLLLATGGAHETVLILILPVTAVAVATTLTAIKRSPQHQGRS